MIKQSVCFSAELNILGLPENKKDELISKLTPRLDFITRRAPSSWRADDTAFLLQRLLIRAGHADATVIWELTGSNNITIKATPGAEYSYGDITTPDVIALSQDELFQYFLQPLVDTELVRITEAPYIAEYTDEGADNVLNYLKSLAYWNCKVSIQSETVNRTSKSVDIVLSIQQGNKLKLSQPLFQGASSNDVAQFSEEITPYINQAATTENINSIKKIVSDFYRENGYHYAEVNMTPRHNLTSTTLVMEISSGEKYQVRDIIINGNEKTKTRRIRRYFDQLKDKDYDQNAADQALGKLLATGAFSNVQITPVPDAEEFSDQLDLVLDVREAKARSVSNYVGVDSYEGAVIGASYTNYNYHGSLRRLDVRGEYSNRGLLGEVGVTEPMFAGAPLILSTKAFLIQRDYEGYDTNKAGTELSLTWIPNNHFSTKLLSGISYTETNTSSLTDSELGPPNYIHSKLALSQTIDFRNSSILPTDGFYTKFLIQAGSITGDASNSYLLTNIQSSYRYQFTEKDAINTRFSTGLLKPNSSDEIPIDVRIFSGGNNSQRAYDERELGPRSISNNPLGGEAYWAATLEYIRTVRDPVKLSLFYDVGQVYESFNDYGFGDPSHAVGIGLRIDLPIGPVRLEYGRNLNKKAREPSGSFHFSIGASF
ncbi:MAG: BamA/OMP85 family outer membrane protein [Akkermansiaceae bacterium]